MFLAKYKHILLALLLLAFTSQSIAFEFMSCQLDTQAPVTSTDASMDMSMHMNMGHSMPMTDQLSGDAPSEAMDCCNTNCECVSSACASIALFSATSDSFIHSTQYYAGLDNSHVSGRTLALLYKPPISR